MFSEVANLLRSRSKPQPQPETKELEQGSKASRKCSSPIYNLLYSIPVSVAPQVQPLQPDLKKSDPKPRLFKKESKKEGILTPSQYAEKMLFGETIKLEDKLP